MKIEIVNVSQSKEKLELGKNLIQEGEFEKAESMLKKAIKLNPKNAEAHFWLGVAFFNKEEYRRAIFVLTKCISLAPDNYKAYGLRGYNHYELFELDRAILDYTKAIELNPDDVISYNNRGLAHEKNGEYELALGDYTKAIELEPNEVSGYYNRGKIYYSRAKEKFGEGRRSISDLNLAIKGDSVMKDDRLIAREKLEEARKNYDMGKYNNTVAYCSQALQFVRFGSDSDIVKEIYFLLGLAHFQLGTSYSEWEFNDSILACKYFDKVIAMDSNFIEAYLYRGLAIVQWGNSGIYVANYKKAIADFDKVLELEPDNETARKYREFCYEELRKEKENSADD